MSPKSETAEDLVGKEFVIVREFDAPRELVWRACTEANHVAQWWGPRGFTAPVCDWVPRPGNKIYVLMRASEGREHPMGGEFREVIPPEKLVTMTGALDADGKFLFQFLHVMTLAEHNGKTKLTMHSRVIEATPEANRYIGGFEMGMTLSLERLASHLVQKTEPLVIERIINAPVSMVWRAITDPEQMKEWYFELEGFQPQFDAEFEFKVEHQGRNYHHLCRVTEVIPQKRLAYTWRYRGYDGDSLVSIDLTAEGNQTRVRLTHLGLESFPPGPDFARENFSKGWTQLITNTLKEFLEIKA